MAKEKTQKKKSGKKPKYIEYRGITGDQIDYRVYHLSAAQTLLAIAAGFAAGFAAAYIYFGNKVLAVLTALVSAYAAIGLYRNRLQKKRLDTLNLQFRDMLDSLSNSFTVGRNANDAITEALKDATAEHGKDAYITRELQFIRNARDNYGMEIKDLIVDFGKRSGIDDVDSFASVFDIATILGGDVGRVIRETRDIISDKIEIQMEIKTMVTSQQNELNIMIVMPFVVVLATKMLVSAPNHPLVLLIKIVAMIIFVVSYIWGRKIVKIKI